MNIRNIHSAFVLIAVVTFRRGGIQRASDWRKKYELRSKMLKDALEKESNGDGG